MELGDHAVGEIFLKQISDFQFLIICQPPCLMGNFYLENISWDTAPFGDYVIAVSSACANGDTEEAAPDSYGFDTITINKSGNFPAQSIFYSLFVWIDGEITVFNRTSMPTFSTFDIVELTLNSASESVINEILPSRRHFYNGALSYEEYYDYSSVLRTYGY